VHGAADKADRHTEQHQQRAAWVAVLSSLSSFSTFRASANLVRVHRAQAGVHDAAHKADRHAQRPGQRAAGELRVVGVHDADHVREVSRPPHAVVEPGQVLRLLQHRHVPLRMQGRV